MNIAIYGGTFDPPHIGHVHIVKEALRVLDIDRLHVVPTYLNPHKSSFFAPAQTRMKWCEILFSHKDKVLVDEFEVTRGVPTPTILTLLHVKQNLNPQKIYLIMGADNYASFERWHRHDEILQIATLVVAKRDNIPIKNGIIKLDIDDNINSTSLRKKLDLSKIPKALHVDVENFYKNNRQSV